MKMFSKKPIDILKAHSIDHLIVIGGDGSMRGATSLAKAWSCLQ